MVIEPSRAAAGFARAKGIVVCVRRLAQEVSGAVAVVFVDATLHGGGAVGKNGVMVRCPPRKTVVIRTLFQPASWCLILYTGSFTTTTRTCVIILPRLF